MILAVLAPKFASRKIKNHYNDMEINDIEPTFFASQAEEAGSIPVFRSTIRNH